MFCSNCGNQIPDDSRFCGNCGNPVSAPQAPVQQPVYQQQTYQSYQPPKQKKKRFNWLILVIILLVAAIVGGIVFYGVNEGWFDGGSSKSSSSSKSNRDKDDEDDDDDDDEEDDDVKEDKKETQEETKAAVREDVTAYTLPGLTFYIGNEWEAEQYGDGWLFTCGDNGIEAELDEVAEAPVEIKNANDVAEWFVDYWEENNSDGTIELRQKNGVPYVYVVSENYDEIGIAAFYVNDPYAYILMAEVNDESLLEDVIYFLTSGKTSSTTTYDVGGLMLEFKLSVTCDEIELEDGYGYGYFEYEAKDIEIEVTSGAMSDVAGELGMSVSNSTDFAKAFSDYMNKYGEQVEYGTVFGRQGEVGYIIYEAEEAVVGFYTDGSTGWLVLVEGDVATQRDEMIELATCGYIK